MDVSDAFIGRTAREALAYQSLIAKGWSPSAANAMAATLAGESGQNLNTGIYQGEAGHGPQGTTWDRLGQENAPETAAGIANWNGPRAIAARDFAIQHGADPNDINSQLSFVDREARAMGLPINSNASPAALTTTFTNQFERPAVNNGPARWASYQNPGAPLTSPPATQGQPSGPLAFFNPTAPMTPPGGASQPTPSTQAPASTPVPQNSFGDILASIASALTQPARPSQAPPQIRIQAPPPDIGALLYGTHPNTVLA